MEAESVASGRDSTACEKGYALRLRTYMEGLRSLERSYTRLLLVSQAQALSESDHTVPGVLLR